MSEKDNKTSKTPKPSATKGAKQGGTAPTKKTSSVPPPAKVTSKTDTKPTVKTTASSETEPKASLKSGGGTGAKTKILTKKKKIIISAVAACLAVVLTLSIVLPIVLSGSKHIKDAPFQAPAFNLSDDDIFALSKYKYSELEDVQTTVRADSMSVTKRNLPRAETTMLSDDFSLVYNTTTNTLSPYYGSYTAKADEKVASISFNPDNYPEPYYKKASKTTGVYTTAASAKGVSEADYFAYYKYMYMTQGQHLAKEAARLSAETGDNPTKTEEFVAWLKKHPSADGQYGEVKGGNNAVEKEIVLDPIYRSLHTSGLYLPAGEPVTIKVEGLKAGERIGITLGSNNTLAWRGGIPSDGGSRISQITGGKAYTAVNYTNPASDNFFKQADILTAGGEFFNCNSGDDVPFLQAQWKRQNARAPWLSCDFTFNENKTYTFGFAFGGLIQINMGNCNSQVKVTISGAVETPHYILGVTSPDYFEEYLKNAPGVLAALDVENGILTGPTGELGNSYCNYMRTVKRDEIDKLAMLWHSFCSVNETFTGGTYNRNNKIMFDWHVPAGAAVSLGDYSFAQPTGWFGDAMNYQKLLKQGTWGTLHEIGHNHGSAYGQTWGFGGSMEGEVRNNALTLLAYLMFCDVGTTVRMGGGAEHGEYANPYRTLTETINNKGKLADFNNAGYFQALGMYANIMHSFSAEKFYELMHTYKTNPSYEISNKRADFAYRCSLIYGMNFLSYFNDFYSAKITDDMFSEEQLASMKALPVYNPVACFYAGGIDGVKTAGDYIVPFGTDIEFDLLKNTISTLDTSDGKGFEIISVGKPTHGSIKNLGDGKYAYSFNPGYGGQLDSFTFKVRLKDGVIHEFTISLRITYSAFSTYRDIKTPKDSGDLPGKITGEATVVEPVTCSGIPAYSVEEGQNVAIKTEYYWRAPKTGDLKFTFNYNKMLVFYFGDSFTNIRSDGWRWSTAPASPNGIELNKVFSVEAGKLYAIRILNYNDSGEGFANIFYKYQGQGEELHEISTSEMFLPTTENVSLTPYQFEPVFMVSQKSNVKLSVAGTDKSTWEVLNAPTQIDGGRYYTEIQYVPQVDANGEEIAGAPPIEYKIQMDKWSYLIDGNTGTHLHTTYYGKLEPFPHEFIVDMKQVQDINYFAVTTRNNVNSYITDYDMYISTDNENWKPLKLGGTRDDYSGTTITVKCETQKARYLKLVVRKTTGGGFSVVSEIDSGIQSPIQKLMTAENSKLFTTDGWVKSSTVEAEQNGYIIADKKNEKAVIKFAGDSVSLYAATGQDYGSVTIKIDGKVVATVDLNSDHSDLRQLIYFGENLKNKEHTMEVITNNSGKVMLGIVGLPYSGNLLEASNIYLERALTISLIVFVCLFVALTVFVLCLLFIPKFRHFMGSNKAITWLDKKISGGKEKRQAKKNAGKEEKGKKAKNKKEKSK